MEFARYCIDVLSLVGAVVIALELAGVI